MPLTPTSNDPNRKNELARKKKDPFSFGCDNKDLNKNHLGNELSINKKSVPPVPEN